jgi:hypothetical protein
LQIIIDYRGGLDFGIGKEKRMSRLRGIAAIALAVFAGLLGVSVGIAVQIVSAHGGDTTRIHGCVQNNSGNIRIVGANDSCRGSESPVDWNIQGVQGVAGPQGPQGPQGPSGSGSVGGIRSDLAGKTFFAVPPRPLSGGFDVSIHDLSNFDFEGSTINLMFAFETNFTGANMKNSTMEQGMFGRADLIGSDLSGAFMRSSSFAFANLTDAIFVSTDCRGCDFNYALFTNANFTNADFTNANLTGAVDATNATFTGVTWNRTGCPDQTTSDDNGGTCIGHLVPLP